MRLSNESLAEQTAMFAGVVISLLGMLATNPGVVFAIGLVMVHSGIVLSCVTSAREIRREFPVRFILLQVSSAALFGVACWIAWGYVSSVNSFSFVAGLARSTYASIYFATRSWLQRHRDPFAGANGRR